MKIDTNISIEETKRMINIAKEGRSNFDIMMKQYIIDIHDTVIKEYGGSYGVRDEALLESSAVAPYQSVFGQDLYPDNYFKAAKYMFDFADYQIFVDGNKRTGLAVCEQFLQANDLELNMTEKEKYKLVMDIANKNINSVEELAEIIKNNVKEYIPGQNIENEVILDEMVLG